MASQLVSVPRIRRAMDSSYDIAVNLSLSHSQNSYYHAIRDESATVAGAEVSKGRSGGRKRLSRGIPMRRLSRLLRKFPESSTLYIFKRVKEFCNRVASSDNSSSSLGAGKEVMAVEPYFSMPVLPVTASYS
ncbi:hypothetical protein Scep_027162 [Stephania cephalantha]|uniref:Uncharacterized protein n=1 Tax=Stephania cephalantha TaxID=152367 RepID=A0AAP0ETP9_9MAGN